MVDGGTSWTPRFAGTGGNGDWAADGGADSGINSAGAGAETQCNGGWELDLDSGLLHRRG